MKGHFPLMSFLQVLVCWGQVTEIKRENFPVQSLNFINFWH